MTEMRELQDARAERARRRRWWKCKCGQRGEAATSRLAVDELWAHDLIAHVEPRQRVIAAEAMLLRAAS